MKAPGGSAARRVVLETIGWILVLVGIAALSSASASSSAATASVAAAPALLSHQAIQQRLQRQIYDLREIWRLLRDPVRRTQYDERRFVLRLDQLSNRPSPAAGLGPGAGAAARCPCERTLASGAQAPRAARGAGGVADPEHQHRADALDRERLGARR